MYISYQCVARAKRVTVSIEISTTFDSIKQKGVTNPACFKAV